LTCASSVKVAHSSMWCSFMIMCEVQTRTELRIVCSMMSALYSWSRSFRTMDLSAISSSVTGSWIFHTTSSLCLVASIPSRWRAALAATLLVGLVAAVLILSGIVQPPSAPFATERVEEETPEWTLSSDQEDGIDGCDCVWRIGCPKFRWQVNFTSPRYRCGYEEMSSSLTQECLAERHRKRGRQLQLRIVGDTREAFITDYIRDRLSLPAARETCRLTRAPPSAKLFDSPEEVHCTVTPLDGADTCEMVYETPEIRLVREVGLLWYVSCGCSGM